MREPERLNLRGDIGATLLRAGRREAPPQSSRRRATVLVGAVFASVAAPSAAAASPPVQASAVEGSAGGASILGAPPSAVAATTAGSGAAVAMKAVAVVVALTLGMAAVLSFSRSNIGAGPNKVTPTLAPVASPSLSAELPSPSTAPVLAQPTTVPMVTARPASQASARAVVPTVPLPSGAAQLGLADEVVALRDAQQTLAGGKPDEALRRLDGFHHDFPRPHLAPEADALLIEALHARGDVAGARSFLAAFRTKYPESPLLEHLDAVVGR